MIKVFISGPMRGIPDWNTPAFMEAEKKLRSLGFEVFNPAWLQFGEGWTHEEIIKIDFTALEMCDFMYRLPGWENSKGATEATNKAESLYIPIYDNIDDIPTELPTKYTVEEIMNKDKEGILEPGRYETIDCPICNSTEHGGLIIKSESGSIRSLTESEECANAKNNSFDFLSMLGNIKSEE